MISGRIWLRVLAPVGVLVAVLWLVDPGAAWAQIRTARIEPLLAALGLSHVVILASALRWSDTARRICAPIHPRRAIGEYYVASFLNLVLPGGVGGDAVRIWRARDAAGTGPAARGVVIERLSGQLAIVAALLVGVALGGVPGTGPLVAAFAVLVAAVLAGLAAFTAVGRDLRRAWGGVGAAGVQIALNAVVALALVGAFWLSARAVGTAMSPTEALVLCPVCLAAMLLPAGFGGIGLREGAAAALWPLAGYSAAEGVAAALLFGIVTLVAALPGSVLLLRHRALPQR